MIGNDRHIEMVDERWESPELKVLVQERISDSGRGDIEYRLANIRRVDPPADLFVVPPEYKFDETSGTGPTIGLLPAEQYPVVSN